MPRSGGGRVGSEVGFRGGFRGRGRGGFEESSEDARGGFRGKKGAAPRSARKCASCCWRYHLSLVFFVFVFFARNLWLKMRFRAAVQETAHEASKATDGELRFHGAGLSRLPKLIRCHRTQQMGSCFRRVGHPGRLGFLQKQFVQ